MALIACGGEDATSRVIVGSGAGRELDAHVPDGAAATHDGGASSCHSAPIVLPLGDSPARSFALALAGSVVHVAFVAADCGGATSSGQGKGLRHVSFTTSGAVSQPVTVGDESCAPLREPTLVARGDQGVELYFGSARGEQFELYRADLARDAAQLEQLTDSAAIELELSAAALGPARTPTLAYVAVDAITDASAAGIHTRQRLAAPLEAVAATLAQRPVQLALVRREAADAGALLAWRDRHPEGPGLYLRSLDARGAPDGEVVPLSLTPGPHSALSLAARAGGLVGIVYTERANGAQHELRYRTWDAGKLGEPVALTGAGTDVTQVALSAFRNGFMVVYRASDAQGQASIRLLALEVQGNAATGGVLALTSDMGTGLEALFSADGRLVVAWDEPAAPDPDAGTALPERQLHIERLTCL